MPNSQPLNGSSTAVATTGTAADFCAELDHARKNLRAALRRMAKALTMPSGNVLLVPDAKAALTAAKATVAHSYAQVAYVAAIAYAVRELQQDPNGSLADSLYLDWNDEPEDADDPYRTFSASTVVMEAPDEEDDHETQPHSSITPEDIPLATNHRKGS